MMMHFLFLLRSYILSALLPVKALSPYEENNIQQKTDAIRQGQHLKYDFLDDYHFPMVADEVRNALFYSALQKAILPNQSKVLDVSHSFFLQLLT
jgi:hypothetical protein